MSGQNRKQVNAILRKAAKRADRVEVNRSIKRAHKVMTLEEYAAMPIIGWHEVCRDVDGCGGVGVRFTGDQPQ